MNDAARIPAESFARASDLVQRLKAALGQAFIGQPGVVDEVLAAMLAGGHVLLEGVPGLGKTLLVQALARAVGGHYARIQFTPDIMPADVTGHTVYDPASAQFTTRRGPVFANFVLADEINRAPAKTQAALLEVMQEAQVTLDGRAQALEAPFMVLATQNPIENEGTYPLPEAQLDRFMLKVRVGYPTRDQEKEVLLRRSGTEEAPVRQMLDPATILALRETIAATFVDQKVVDYIVDLVRATRDPSVVGLANLRPLVAFGASPRASIALVQAAKAHAFLRGRGYVIPEDVRALALDVLRHRVLLTFEAEAEEIDADQVVTRILDAVPVP